MHVPESPAAVSRRAEMLHELRLLIEALDRRLPQLDRLGEAQIVEEASELRRKAVALIDEMTARR